MKDNESTMADFFGKLNGHRNPHCILCGQPISPERIKEFPKTKFCKTECTLMWMAKQEKKDG